ncbi:WD40 repeat domain-containing protein [Streptomyces luteolifulvus]|uniref:WD40 repeat domain-containing protein n=1 Tax=Streptomyces luteolifulvus TaxID=2615112 RepID=A0A6H9UUR2_9ACTN|nr:WD40 repeat domain-containing protein [Streptomyces luteolifulvus]KAB1143646.1 WD40 repeat domain-containing protein [Streptomyces luteolifulvus]
MTETVQPRAAAPLLATAGAAAVLVATVRTADDARFPPVPAAAHSLDDLARLLVERCGLAPGRLTRVVDPAGPEDVIGAVTDVLARAPDVLLLYFVGHSEIGEHNELRLSTGRTGARGAAMHYSSLDFAHLVQTVSSASPRPQSVIVVLDCCYAGRALSVNLGPLRRSYLLTASSPHEQALAPLGERHTAMTGRLIGLLERGAPGLPADLTLHDVASHLRENLTPTPMVQSRGSAEVLCLGRNVHPEALADRAQRSAGLRRDSGVCPYPGLRPFDAGTARWFRGRDRLTSRLAVALTAPFGPPLPVMLLGASGSGKSSLIHAGLLGDLARARTVAGSERRPRIVLTPTDRPLDALAEAFSAPLGRPREVLRAELDQGAGTMTAWVREVAARQDTGPFPGPAAPPEDGAAPGELVAGPVIVVDQFEEAFTLCEDPAGTTVFVEALCAAARATAPAPVPGAGGAPLAAHVLLATRADFLGVLASHPPLLEALHGHQVVVSPLTHDEVREAVLGPAHAEGLEVEEGLVEVIVGDLGVPPGDFDAAGSPAEQAGYDASMLPHLAQALLVTWQSRRNGLLTRAAYRASGGIASVVASEADKAYQSLDAEDRRTARLLLTRLVQSVEGRPPTRRRATRDRLLRELGDPERTQRVLERLRAARLVALDSDAVPGRETVQLVHEALLPAWPTMRNWLEQDRDWLARRQQILQAAHAWHEAEDDESVLYTGRMLDEAWAAAETRPKDDLGGLGWRFLRASAQRERRSARSLRIMHRTVRLLSAAVACLVLLMAAGGVRWADREETLTVRQKEHLSRSLAARSDVLRAVDPVLAGRLAVAAFRSAPTAQARASLYASAAAAMPARESQGSSTLLPSAEAVAFAPGGSHLAVQAGAEVLLWDTGRHRTTDTLDLPDGRPLLALGYSPRIDLLVGMDSSGRLLGWRTGPGPPHRAPVVLSGEPGEVADSVEITFRADGGMLAAAQVFGLSGARDRSDTRLWRVTGGGELTDAGTLRHTYAVFGPYGETLAERHDDGRLLLGRGQGDGRTLRERLPADRQADVRALPLSFSPDGRLLAEGRGGGRVALWSVRADGSSARLTSPSDGFQLGTGTVHSLGFSPDSRSLAVAADAVNLWDVSDDGPPRFAGTVDRGVDSPKVRLPEPVGKVVFGGRTSLLAVTGEQTRLWDVGSLLSPGHLTTLRLPGSPSAVALSPDAREVAVGLRDGTVRRYALGGPGRPARALAPVPSTGSVSGPVGLLAFRPHGRTLLVGRPRTTELWAVGTGGLHRENLPGPAAGTAVEYAPSSDVLLTSDPGGGHRLWDLSAGSGPRQLPGLRAQGRASTADPALSSRGNRLLLQDVSAPSLYGIGKPEGARARELPNPEWGAVSSYERFDPWPRIALSPDGSVLATARGGTLSTYRLDGTGEPATQTSVAAHLTHLAFSRNGTLLATGDDTGRVRLWSTGGDAELRPLTDYARASAVTSLAFGPQDTLAVGYADTTVTVSRLAPAFLMSRVCATAPPDSITTTWTRYAKDVPLADVCPTADD